MRKSRMTRRESEETDDTVKETDYSDERFWEKGVFDWGLGNWEFWVRLGDVSISSTNGTGEFRFSARVLVRNRNFGHYKFDDTMATIKNGDVTIGQFVIPESRAKARSTKRFYIIDDINSSSAGNHSGVLPLSVEAKLRGKVHLMKVIKRKKSADMNCTMSINLATNAVQDLNCN
ncbi:late embryogenesis abundant At1g64065-like [Olea europaea subsp. europaea]|uniref:Late embryogenesis abundant At1g64065-like n=1 Tax=Olea europaea subsp. europaea TaxID=158383 RepID=A0A8S0SLZ2_OLEEU|nr:late embryogenesis abundant At1g64065-like [Olea europaea subsp. europaea]